MRAQPELVVTQRDRQDVNLSLFLFLSQTLVSGAFTCCQSELSSALPTHLSLTLFLLLALPLVGQLVVVAVVVVASSG